MIESYVVKLDGRVIERGLSRREAESRATYLARGFESKRAGTRIHHPHVEIARDVADAARQEATYKWWKANH